MMHKLTRRNRFYRFLKKNVFASMNIEARNRIEAEATHFIIEMKTIKKDVETK